jgi:catechol 2,3-dioxygenase-like lactoylglutathione lyase family enzyme
VNTPDPDAEVERLLGLGARLVARRREQVGPIDECWTVLRDPEGNGFCVQGPDTRRNTTYLRNITFACESPPRLAAFWRDVLGYEETDLPEELARQILEAGVDPAQFDAYGDAVDPEGKRPRLLFQRRQKTPAHDPPLRLELAADDVESAAVRLRELGATVLADTWLDPEGNVFTLAPE